MIKSQNRKAKGVIPPLMRMRQKHADEKYFREVKQWGFCDKEGGEIYLDVGVFPDAEAFSEFVPPWKYGQKHSGWRSTYAKIWIFVPSNEGAAR